MAGLTAKQEGFINDVVSGKSYTEAFKNNYNTKNWQEKSINEKASQFMKNVKIKSRYDELIKKHQDKAIMTKDELLEGLRFAFKMALGLEATPMIMKALKRTPEGQNYVEVEEEKYKVADLKALSSIAHQIAKLEGWEVDKVQLEANIKHSYAEMTDAELKDSLILKYKEGKISKIELEEMGIVI